MEFSVRVTVSAEGDDCGDCRFGGEDENGDYHCSLFNAGWIGAHGWRKRVEQCLEAERSERSEAVDRYFGGSNEPKA